MANITINGQKITVNADEMIIQAADRAGIYIPRFCYHEKLCVAANCRMCLVDVEKSPKTLPACATPVRDGMVINTISDKTKRSQKAVMEFLLANHPLDCPVCDQGGECELQDLAMGYGMSKSRYTFEKRAVVAPKLGPLIATEMNRCIHCTRCVRFGQDLAGHMELGGMGRGENLAISNYIAKSIESELSGNMIDLCPVGALTSKPYRFSERTWAMFRASGVSGHDCLGSNIYWSHKDGKIKRILPKPNENINEIWLSDRDRFSYLGLQHEERLLKHYIKLFNDWQTESEEALYSKLSKKFEGVSGDDLVVLAHPQSTTEDLYYLQKFTRSLGSNNIDTRLFTADFKDELDANLHHTTCKDLSVVENMDVIIVIGGEIATEQPILGLKLRKAIKKGAIVYNITDGLFDKTIKYAHVFSDKSLIDLLMSLTYATLDKIGDLTIDSRLFATLKTKKLHKNTWCQLLTHVLEADNVLLINSAKIQQYENGSDIRYMGFELCKLFNASIINLKYGANAKGAYLAGALPFCKYYDDGNSDVDLVASNIENLLIKSPKILILFNMEPEFDCIYSNQVANLINKAETVVVINSFASKAMFEYADVLIPLAPYSEVDGTFVNIFGQAQHFSAAVCSQKTVRSGWSIIAMLAEKLNLSGFAASSAKDVWHELNNLEYSMVANIYHPEDNNLLANSKFIRLAGMLPHSQDCIVRRSDALQKTPHSNVLPLVMNQVTADNLSVLDGDFVHVQQMGVDAELQVSISDKIVTNNSVYIPSGKGAECSLPKVFGEIIINKLG